MVLIMLLAISASMEIAVDIGRRLPSENGISKSIVVCGASNCNHALILCYHVLREVVACLDMA